MDLQHLVATIKARPDYHKVGMIACHNGVVRSTSRDAREVEGLKIQVDRELLESILGERRGPPGDHRGAGPCVRRPSSSGR